MTAAFERLDAATREHSLQVSRYSAILAQTIGVPPAQVSSITLAAKFHEIGKLAVPETILYKPAKLTAEEQAILREYPLRGYEMMRQEQSLVEAAEIVYCHRENFDGTGYPRRLKGESIPLGARIVAIADTFAMFVSDQPHRPEHAINAARNYVCRWSGNCFDPLAVEIFGEIPNHIWQSARPTSES